MMDLTERVAQELHQLALDVYQSVAQLRDRVIGPPAPDEEIRKWPLWADEYGGIYCGDPECPLMAERSLVLGLDPPEFTLDELYDAIARHIAERREWERDNVDS